jgi:hypothetical protein
LTMTGSGESALPLSRTAVLLVRPKLTGKNRAKVPN